MNQTTFAKRAGISQARVSKLIRDGILTSRSVKRKGKIYDINLRRGLADLKANLDPGRKVKARAVGRRKVKAKPRPATRAKPKKKKAPAAKLETLQDARTRKEIALADKHEFEIKVLDEKYIDVKAVKSEWTRHVAAAKVRILGIPSKVTPVAREMIKDKEVADTIIQLIEAEVEGALVELMDTKL